ncbi:hypothetical protein KCU95_g2332, partial [Aureobasidium melanogenum]
MCDPFNNRLEDALWDECHDLDPFMAEHYAANAQHELDRLAISQPVSARVMHVLRLYAAYSAIAATAQLPEDSDFYEPGSAEQFETERLGTVHPDRLALMRSGREDSAPPISQAEGRPPTNVYTDAKNSVVSRNARKGRRSRESSVEPIVREGNFDTRGNHQHDHVNHNQLIREHDASFHDSFQPSTEFHESMLAMARMHNATYTDHPISVNNNHNYESWSVSSSIPATSQHSGGSSCIGRRKGRRSGCGRDAN